MAIERSLNFYTHTQLNTYAHTTIAGTIHFSVEVTVTGNRDVIGNIAGVNTVTVTFTSTSAIDKWECRAALSGQSHGVGIGLLIGSGGAVGSGIQTHFDVQNTALTFGDGVYRISMYVQKDNIWYGG